MPRGPMQQPTKAHYKEAAERAERELAAERARAEAFKELIVEHITPVAEQPRRLRAV